MGWPWISLSLLNSFFLNPHFVVEQMNPRCKKNSSHSQWMKSWLIKGKTLFLSGSESQDNISWSWEGTGNFNKSHKENFLGRQESPNKRISFNVLSSSKCFPENLPPWLSPGISSLLLRPGIGSHKPSYPVLKGWRGKSSSRTPFIECWAERE